MLVSKDQSALNLQLRVKKGEDFPSQDPEPLKLNLGMYVFQCHPPSIAVLSQKD